METAVQAANQALLKASKSPAKRIDSAKQNSSALTGEPLRQFWLRMAALFGNTWVSSYGASPAGIGADTWSKALRGLTPLQIAHGLHETLVLGSDFPPSAPRFRRLCFGIPSLLAVKGIMRRNEFDRFVCLVRSKLDNYVFARVDQRTADRMLKEAYEEAAEHVMRGGELPPEPEALLEQQKEERRRASDETVRKACADIEKILNVPCESSEPETSE